ncbi:MAG: diguanylate cyclase, partial [Ruminococcaceae bacterium]|nr:diguanylate cyclase [Oscillospiraceae bacterium]
MKKYYSPIFSIMFWVVMAVFIAVAALNLFSVPQSQKENLCQTDMEWFSSKDIPLDIYDPLQVSRITEDKVYSVYFTADNSAENTALAFKTDFSEVKVYINDKQVYSSNDNLEEAEEKFFSFDAPVSGIHIVDIEKVNAGDKIRLEVKTFYKDTVCGVGHVLFGSSYDILNTVFNKDIFGMVICVIVFAIGTLMFIFHFSFKKVIATRSIKYTAYFAFLAALHVFSEWATLSFMFLSGSKAIYVLHILTFSFMMLPLIMFFIEKVYHRSSEKLLKISAVIQAVFILFITALAAFNVFDLHKSSRIAELVALAQCIFILVVLFYDLGRKKQKRSTDWVLPILNMAFNLCAVIGHIIDDGSYISILFITSCLLFLSLVLIINMREVADTLRLSNEVEEMGKAAFTDALTGVGNTAAFNKKMSHLEVVKLNYKSIAIIQFDINNLKTINDNLGHEQGDKLIKDGSAIIYKVFGKIGKVYRTGGDEFVGVIYGDDAMNLCYNAIASFNMAIDEYNSDESHKFILQIAYGSEYYDSDSDRRYMTLKEIQKQADANM